MQTLSSYLQPFDSFFARQRAHLHEIINGRIVRFCSHHDAMPVCHRRMRVTKKVMECMWHMITKCGAVEVAPEILNGELQLLLRPRSCRVEYHGWRLAWLVDGRWSELLLHMHIIRFSIIPYPALEPCHTDMHSRHCSTA